MWIPAGTLLKRPRIAGKDDLFSNWHQTTSPTVALFLKFTTHEKCSIMLDGQNWSVETRNVRHSIMEKSNAS